MLGNIIFAKCQIKFKLVQLEIVDEHPSHRRFASMGRSLPRGPNALLGNLLKRFFGRVYEYDARGNLVRRESETEGVKTYQWDASNRLQSVRHGEASTFYYYDALGRRLAKVHQATATEVPQSTYYGWNGHQLSLEEAEKVHYVYLGDSFEPVAQERTWLRPPSHWSGGPLDPNDPEYIDPDQQTQGGGTWSYVLLPCGSSRDAH